MLTMTLAEQLDINPETMRLINRLAPDHSRTSCSDKNLYNALRLDDKGKVKMPGRCVRCSLLFLATLKSDAPDSDEGVFWSLS